MSTTTTSLQVSPPPPTLNTTPLLLEARVELVAPGGGEIPTGSMTFMDGASAIGTVPVDELGYAAFTTLPVLSPGQHSFYAVYLGDAVFDMSTSAPVVRDVPAAVDISIAASLVSPPYGQVVTLTATLAWFELPSGEAPTGSVLFKVGADVLGSASINASGEAAFAAAAIPAGSHLLTAEYPGDDLFAAAVSAPEQHDVVAAASTVEISISPSPAEAGRETSVVVTASLVAPSTAAPAGQVTVYQGESSIGSAQLDAGGKATIVVTGLPVGTLPLHAVYAGDGNATASTSPTVSLLVMAATGLNLVALEDALHAWVEAALGLKAVWSHPNVPAPATPYGWLTLAGPARAGEGELVEETNLSNPAGQEVERTAIEHEEWLFGIEVIAHPTSGAGSARALLAASAMRLRLPSALDGLRAAGLAVVDFGDTQDLTALFATTFESRARLTVRLRSVNTAMETAGYIEKVGISSPFGAWPQLPP